MMNQTYLLASFGTVFAVVFTTVVFALFLIVLAMVLWTEKNKSTFKNFWLMIGKSISNLFLKIGDAFDTNAVVKTVYSDKSLNYSGTEFLPIPTKAPTNQYTYEFVGWDKNGIDENGNTVVRAIYLQKVTKCYVNVFDDDKTTLLKSYEVEYGSGVNLADLKPVKHETKEFAYEFVGWDKNTEAFYKNENVYAVYNAIPKKYKYTFFEEDGTTIVNEGTAIYGTPINAPAAPKKAADSAGIYEFSGWKGFEEGMLLTKDMTFVATYTAKAVGQTGSSSIIKTDGENVKVVPESKLDPSEDFNHEEIRKAKAIQNYNFDTPKDVGKTNVTEIKMGSSGVIRKKGGVVIQKNDEVEKFQKINAGDHNANTDKEVHQKIQLMTVKKSADVEDKDQKVIAIKPKDKKNTEDAIIGNMMVNKIKIGKKSNR